MRTRALLSGYIGFQNFGDDATHELLIEHLKGLDCEVAALSGNPSVTQKVFGIKAFKYKDFKEIFNAVLNCDVLIQGGGNLIQNETSFLNLFYYLSLILLAKILFKKVILFSQGIGPVDGKFSNMMCHLLLKLPDLIIVRDIYSQRALTKWHIRSTQLYDAVWDIETLPYAPEKVVGVSIRHFDKMHPDFCKNLAGYIDKFFSDSKIKIFSLENSADSKICYELDKLIKKRNEKIDTSIVLYKNPKQIVEEFANLEYLIAMRLHANILGLKYGVKILPVVYSTKVQNFAQEFDIPCANAEQEGNLLNLLNNLTGQNEQTNPKIQDAKKRKFEWAYIDTIIKKIGQRR